MKKYFYLLTISFSFISCYTYRTSVETDVVASQELPKKKSMAKEAKMAEANALVANISSSDIETSSKMNPTKTAKVIPTNIQDRLEANKYFKIEVGDKSYKIQVNKWENDTLVAHVIHKPKKILKFHKNQINQTTIAERRFSQPVADIITVTAYAAIGVGIWALVK